jgi:filamentous hemagglutinin family protein
MTFTVRRILPCVLAACAIAQSALAFGGSITLDGTLGHAAAAIPSNSGLYVLTRASSKKVGSNLFFSLGQFNLDKGDTAQFSGPNSVTNVLTRVTGGQSMIDGTIQCTIPNAAFYLINPAGVVFGPDSALDVQGSFAVTTADEVKLSDGVKFGAPGAADATLSSAAPAAFGFLKPAPAPISMLGAAQGLDANYNVVRYPTLQPGAAGSLMVAGGDITIVDGQLTTGNAQPAVVVSVGSKGQLNLNQPMDVSSFSSLGAVTVSDGGVLGSEAAGAESGAVSVAAGSIDIHGMGTNLLGTTPSFVGSASGSGRAGLVSVLATGEINLSGGGELGSDGSGVLNSIAFATNTTDSGTVTVIAGSISIRNGSKLGSITGSGSAQSVEITSHGVVSIANGSEISSDAGQTDGTDSGPVTVTASGISVVGTGSSISSLAGSGQAGAVSVIVRGNGPVSVSNGATIESSGQGGLGFGTNGGNVTVSAGSVSVTGVNDALVLSSAIRSRSGLGTAGDVSVTAHHGGLVDVEGGSFIGSDATDGAGSGNVTVSAGNITVSGANPYAINPQPSAITSINTIIGQNSTLTLTAAGGQISVLDGGQVGLPSGNVQVTAGEVILNREGSVFPTGIAGGRTLAGNYGDGVATISVQADSLRISNGAAITTDSIDEQSAGSISLSILNNVTMKSGGLISSRSFAGGMGGDISLTTNQLKLDNGMILASNSRGMQQGGRLQIAAGEMEIGNSSILSASAGGGLQLPLSAAVELTFPNIVADGPVSLNGNLFVVSPTGVRIQLSATITSGQTVYADAGAFPSIDSFKEFGAQDLDGVWKLEVLIPATPPGDFSIDQPVLNSWTLTLGGQKLQTSTVSVSEGGASFYSPLNVANVPTSLTGVTGGGNGGDMNIASFGTVLVRNSQLAAFSGQTGGNIVIDPALMVLQNSQLVASGGMGSGGNVTITAGQFLRSNTIINVSSQFGVVGTVLVNSPDTDIAGSLIGLRADLAAASALLQPACAQMVGTDVSTFVQTGNGGLPPEPGGFQIYFDPFNHHQH